MAIPASVGLFILSQPLLKILTTSEFLVGGGLVLLIAVGTIFLGIYQINAYIVALVKQTKWFPLMIVSASATSAVLNIVLIPRVGITGAAISNIIAYFVLATIVSVWAKKTVNYGVDLKYLGKAVLAALIMGLILKFMNVHGASGIILSVIIGTTIFGLVLFVLRAFTKQDKQLIMQIFTGLIPKSPRNRE
jgi:O-antigen/teichoic acid export membrane protein